MPIQSTQPTQKVSGLFHCRFEVVDPSGVRPAREKLVHAPGRSLDAATISAILLTLEADQGTARGTLRLLTVSLIQEAISLADETQDAAETREASRSAAPAQPGPLAKHRDNRK